MPGKAFNFRFYCYLCITIVVIETYTHYNHDNKR